MNRFDEALKLAYARRDAVRSQENKDALHQFVTRYQFPNPVELDVDMTLEIEVKPALTVLEWLQVAERELGMRAMVQELDL